MCVSNDRQMANVASYQFGGQTHTLGYICTVYSMLVLVLGHV